jgi:FkbM family methyltransferase
VSCLKKSIKSLFNAVGFDLHRLSPSSSLSFRLLKTMNQFEVDLVFDIGGNVGQFASELRLLGYEGELISFEPLSLAHNILSKVSIRDPRWHVHSRCAIGDYNGEIKINIAGNSVSSSVLPMLDSHSSAAEGSAYVSAEMVPVFMLDSLAPEYLVKSHRPFLKIDAQGFEWQILEGARKTLPHIKGILCELSLLPLYEGQRLWLDMIRRLEREGFTLWAIREGFTDPSNGRMLQIDATFFRL